MVGRLHAKRRDTGAAAVEFALVSVLLFTLLFGILQYGLYFWSLQTGSAAAKEAARRASVGDCTDAELKALVANRIGGAKDNTDPTKFTVTRTFTDASNVAVATPVVGGSVIVAVQFPTYNMHFPFVPFLGDPTVQRTETVRMEDTTASGACQ